MKNWLSKNIKSIILILLINLGLLLYVYQGVFSLQFEGDSWFYGWGHKIYYENNVFSPLSLQGMHTSLAGASLTFGLIENHFGLNAIVFYTISVLLKLVSVMAFYFLVKKITNNFFISFIASSLLSVTFAGVEATHWVFNMYAYIGLTFVIISMIIGLDLPEKFTFKKWFFSFFFACLGVWYATMRVNGIIPLVIIWAIYKFIALRSKSSKKNLIFWIVGLFIFILIDKFALGQMESDYSRVYIINEGIKSINNQLSIKKYDFLLSSATNLGAVILPDITWNLFNFFKVFSSFGLSVYTSIIFSSFLLFSLITTIFTSMIYETKKILNWSNPFFIKTIAGGFLYTLVVLIISKMGSVNFPSWPTLVMTLFGGYMFILCLSFIFSKKVSPDLRDLFFLAFFWFFLFLLLPLFQNGGPIFGTYHRYMATTAPSVPLFMAGLLILAFKSKNQFARLLVLGLIFIMFFSHAFSAKAFFDRKAVAHNRTVSNRIWKQLAAIIPNKPQYRIQPPAVFFAAADNPIDQETLFESLSYSYDFRSDLEFGWPHNQQSYLYNSSNYKDLLAEIKKNPKLLDDFYALMVQDQNLFDITKQVKDKIASDIQQ